MTSITPRHRLLMIFTSLVAFAATPSRGAEGEWQSLFNGRDLNNWINVNCAPSTWTVRDEMIISTGVPTGVMRTKRHYENFEMELDWRHMRKGGNAGVFVWSDPVTSPGVPFTRGIEVQVLDGRNGDWFTSHGDVFAIHGAKLTPDRPHPKGAMRCLPSEMRAKDSPEWNHYRILCTNGVIQLAVNGKVVSGGSNCVPRRGYICLESEGTECHFRNIRVREFPGSNPPAPEIADLDEGFVSLYTGTDLSGWKDDPGHKGHWQPKDWVLDYDGRSTAGEKSLWSEKSYKDFVLIVDWRFTRKPQPGALPVILPNGEYATNADGTRRTETVPVAGDSGIYLRGNSKSQVNIWSWPVGSGEVYGYREDKDLSPEVRAGVTPKMKADKPAGEWNRFVITMLGDRLTVVLNGKMVIEKAQLPGVPAMGPIALQDHGDPVQFANIYIKELK